MVRGNTVEHIVATLLKAEIPAAPVNTIAQAVKDPHMWEREMMVKMPDALAGEMYLPGATIKMSKTPGRVAPGADVLRASTPTRCCRGCSATTPRPCAELRDAKVIG